MDQEFMKEKPVMPLVISMALPMTFSMLVNALYNIIDSYFVAQISEDAMTALSLVFPLQNLVNAVVIGFAIGMNATMAYYLGARKQQLADKTASLGMLLNMLHGLVLAAICIAVMPAFLGMFTKQVGIVGIGVQYSDVVFLFAVPNAAALCFEKIFQAVGRMKTSMFCMLLGCVTNIVLDPLLIFGIGIFPAMGIRGAALATGIGQMIPAVVGTVYFFFFKGELHFVPFHFHGATLKQSCFNGSSEMVSNLANAIITYLFNIILMRIAGENGVAAITIILYAQFLFNSLYLGFSIGVAPVIGFQYGAKNRDQLKSLYKICNCFVIASSVVIAFFSWLLSDGIASIFVQDRGETYVMASEGLRIFALSFLFSGFNIFSSSLFTALSDGKTSAIISFGRTCVFIILSLMILPNILGLTGVWLAIPVAEFLAVFVSVYYQWTKRKKYGYL
mgnify:CR=1 FL=1